MKRRISTVPASADFANFRLLALSAAIAAALTQSTRANAEKDITAIDLTNPNSYSPVGLPTVNDDVTAGIIFPTGNNTTLGLNGNTALTFGSYNVVAAVTPVSLGNLTAGTVATLTLGGPGSTGNSVAPLYGGTSSDLIFNAFTTNVTLTNSAGTLNVVLGQSGSFDVATTGTTLNMSTAINVGAFNLSLIGAGSQNLSGGISGSGAITVANTGTGVVTFSGNNTFTGAVTVNTGAQFQFSGTNVNSAGLGTSIVNNGTVFNARAGANTVAQIISGSGTLNQNGGGTSTYNAANSYTGATILQGGIFNLTQAANGGANSQLGASSNAVANLLFNGGTLQYTGTVAGSTDRLFSFGNATANQAANIDVSGTGSLTFSNTGAIGFTSANIAKVVNLTGTSTALNTFNPQITNNGTGVVSVTKNGTGVWVLGNTANTYTGNTTVNAGLLLLTPGSLGGTGATLTIAAAGAAGPTVAIDQAFLSRIASASPGTIALVADSAANLDLSATGANLTAALLGVYTGNTVNYTGTLTPNGTTYRLGGGGGTLNFNSNLTGANALTVNNATAAASSTVVLNGTNTYTGATTVAGGTLRIGNATALPATGSIILTGGGLTPFAPVDQALVGRITSASTGGSVNLIGNNANNLDFTAAGAAGLGSSGNFTYSGTLTPNATNGYRLGGGGGTLTVSSNLAASGTVGLTVSSGGLATSGVTLTGNNTYTGATVVNGGTLTVGSATALPATTLTLNNPTAGSTLTVDLGGNTQSLANFNLGTSQAAANYVVRNGSIALTGANPLTINPQASTGTVDLSQLTSLTYNNVANSTFIGGNAAAPVANVTVRLPQTTGITTNNVNFGSIGTTSLETIDLGQSTTLNVAGNIQLGGFNNGSTLIDFQAGLTNPTFTLRGGTGGVSAVPNLFIGANNNGTNKTSTLNFTGGTFDAIASTVLLSTSNTNGAVTSTVTLDGANSILNVGTLTVTTSASVNAGANPQTATFNQNGGRVLANALGFNGRVNQFTPAVGATLQPNDVLTSTYNLGTATTTATLSAVNIAIVTGAATAANAANIVNDGTASRATLNFVNGRIQNYDPSLGQAGSAGAAGGPTVATDLTIAGATGGGTAINNATLNIAMPATGTHSFFAQSGRTITVAPTALLTGAGGPTIDGPGTVVFNGANTYAGATNIQAGTLRATAPAYTNVLTNAGGLNITGGRTQFDYAGTTSPVATVKTLLDAAYAANSGTFATGQIRSTPVVANRTLGYGDNGTNTVTILYTIGGDATLDGTVDFSDFLALQTNFGNAGTRFDQGNFNYDGFTDFSDFLILQTNFGQSINGSAVAFTSEQVAALTAFASTNEVPEPAALAAIGTGLLMVGRRRRAS